MGRRTGCHAQRHRTDVRARSSTAARPRAGQTAGGGVRWQAPTMRRVDGGSTTIKLAPAERPRC